MTYYTLKDPVHPGELLLEDVLPHFRLSITDAATHLQITRANLSNVLNGKAALSAELATKVEAAFGVDAAMLNQMMAAFALAKARSNPDVTRGIERIGEPV